MDQAERRAAIQRVLGIELTTNLVVAAAKAAYGIYVGSLAIVTDAAHSLLDAVNSIVGVVVIRFSSAPPDRGHPYGHAKHEILAAVGLGLAIAVTAAVFAVRAVTGIGTDTSLPRTGSLGVVVLVGTLGVNLVMARYMRRRARQLRSAYLAADAADTVGDIVVTLGVLVSFGASHAGVHWADPVAALLVAVFIANMAWGILRSNIPVLLDRAAIEPKWVYDCVMEHPEIIDCHQIRSRGPLGTCHVDFHAVIRGKDVTLEHAHRIVHELEEKVEAEVEGVVDVVVHIEPEQFARDDQGHYLQPPEVD